MSNFTKPFCSAIIIMSITIGLSGCSPWSKNCKDLKNVDFLFDGGSIVFSLSGIDLSHKYFMISPIPELDQKTGEIQEAKRVSIYLINKKSDKYSDKKPLMRGSMEERQVLEYLKNCKDHFTRDDDPWNEKVETIIKMIKNHDNPPPEVYYW